MLKRLISSVAQNAVPDIGGIYLAVNCRQSYDLVTRGLNSACFMSFYVRGLGRHDALMRAQCGGNYR